MEKTKNNFWLGFFVGLAVVSVVCFAGLLVFVLSQGEAVNLAEKVQAAPETEQPTEASAQPVPAVTADDHLKGSADAKVILIEYSDFECPYCAAHAQTISQIAKNYSKDVAIVFRHFPLSFHANAQKAAEASECAARQGKFWEMHDKLFDLNQKGNMGIAQFKSAAKEIGLDTGKFDDCLDSGQTAREVSSDMAGGQQAGVSGTPGTFVNGQLVSGALPYDQFSQFLDQLLVK
ncbi:MAG: DsbA family protein [Patescibacteria group bacterium]